MRNKQIDVVCSLYSLQNILNIIQKLLRVEVIEKIEVQLVSPNDLECGFIVFLEDLLLNLINHDNFWINSF